MKTTAFLFLLILISQVSLFADDAPRIPCRDPYLARARLNKQDLEANCLYDLQNVSVFQKTSDGYLMQVSLEYSSENYDTPPPMFLYAFPSFQFNNQNYELSGFTAYYVGDYSYNTITGFDKVIHAFKIGTIPEKLKPENMKFYTAEELHKAANESTDEPNFISQNGRVIPNPNKRHTPNF